MPAPSNVKRLARKALTLVHLYEPAVRWRRRPRRRDRRLAQRYLAETAAPKLHIGCGYHPLAGWLNTDLIPRSDAVMRLDAARPFPFPSHTFAYAHSEHLIGSLSLPDAAHMLRECWRVLAPGGKMRISTPDLAFLIDLYGPARSPLQERYIAWAGAGLPRREIGFIINHFMRAWGHQYVYDEPVLREFLAAAGFTGVVKCGLQQSDDPALRNLENAARLPDGFLRLESLILEAAKPPERPAKLGVAQGVR